MRGTVAERLEYYTIEIEGHEIWCGTIHKGGYGTMRDAEGRNALAHRLAWELECGPIPEGVEVLHRNECHHPACHTIAHLYLGTQRENGADIVEYGNHPQASKTNGNCGHPLDATFTQPNGRPGRYCRTCKRDGVRARRALARGAS
jgi:hypothetical protein